MREILNFHEGFAIRVSSPQLHYYFGVLAVLLYVEGKFDVPILNKVLAIDGNFGPEG